MIYFELCLDGAVKVYEMSDRLLLLRALIETRGRALEVADTIDDAVEYFRAGCYQFECFETIDQADDWQCRYQGFRSGEVRAEFRRFMGRRIMFPLDTANILETEAA